MLTRTPTAGADGAQADAPRRGTETGREGVRCKMGDRERRQLSESAALERLREVSFYPGSTQRDPGPPQTQSEGQHVRAETISILRLGIPLPSTFSLREASENNNGKTKLYAINVILFPH